MNASQIFTPEMIHAAAEALQKLRPAYGEILLFYKNLFIIQETFRSRVQLTPVEVPKEIRALKLREKQPLVDISDFRYDPQSARELLIKICDLIQSGAGEMAVAAERIVEGLDNVFQAQALFGSLLQGDDANFVKTADAIDIDKNTLAFVVYSSLKPSLTVCAAQLLDDLGDTAEWEKGYCPVCGSFPGLAVLDHDGRRFLHCRFCWTTWLSKRIFCPFCGKSGGPNLLCLVSEQEKDLRVDACGDCKSYLKTVDSRMAERILYPPMEQIASLHLDITARQKGYYSDMALFLKEASE